MTQIPSLSFCPEIRRVETRFVKSSPKPYWCSVCGYAIKAQTPHHRETFIDTSNGKLRTARVHLVCPKL